jgi:hypothetical protein
VKKPRVVGAIQPAADPVRFDVGGGQDPSGLTRRDADTVLALQVLGDTAVGPLGVGVRGFTGRGRDDQHDVVGASLAAAARVHLPSSMPVGWT